MENFSAWEYYPDYTQIEIAKNGPPRIPRVIHQIWNTKNYSEYPNINSHLYWNMYYPTYEIKLWTLHEIENLVHENFPHLLQDFLRLQYDIQRADIGRYLILYTNGGFYVDLDTFPAGLNLDDFRSFDTVVPFATDGNSLSTHFLGSAPRSSFFYRVFTHFNETMDIQLQSQYFTVFVTSGPFYFQKEFEKYYSTHGNETVLLLPQRVSRKYFFHIGGRSWHQLDGIIINFFGDHWKTIIVASIFIGILILIIKSYCLQRRKELNSKEEMVSTFKEV